MPTRTCQRSRLANAVEEDAAHVSARTVDGWLRELGLTASESAEREGVHSWDLVLDGRVRHGVPITLIFDQSVGLVCWVHYAPPLADGLRKVYRQLLRWNDELPFVKFALADDDRPVLSDEVPLAGLDRDAIGLTIARLLAVCDLLYPESAGWVDRIAKVEPGGESDGTDVLERYAARLGELGTGAAS